MCAYLDPANVFSLKMPWFAGFAVLRALVSRNPGCGASLDHTSLVTIKTDE